MFVKIQQQWWAKACWRFIPDEGHWKLLFLHLLQARRSCIKHQVKQQCWNSATFTNPDMKPNFTPCFSWNKSLCWVRICIKLDLHTITNTFKRGSRCTCPITLSLGDSNKDIPLPAAHTKHVFSLRHTNLLPPCWCTPKYRQKRISSRLNSKPVQRKNQKLTCQSHWR